MPLMTLRRVLLPLATLLALLVASPALADSDTVTDLGISPLDYDGSWFDLELEPGEQVDLEVEVANHGDQTVEARTYVADVYSLINGGMGVSLYGEPAANSASGWIDYPSSTPMLQTDSARRRTVTVVVPDDAQPGQYITALAIEHEADRPDDTEGLGIDQVIRQAVAVNITVPGPAVPKLELGGTSHLLTGGRSTLRTSLDNGGNWHLVPAGDLEVVGPDGTSITEQSLELAIVYADTTTHVETVLDHELAPGIYTITTTLADATHEVETTHASTFEVEAAPRDAAVVPGMDRVIATLDSSGLGLLGAALLTLGLLLAGLLIVVARRRRSRPASQLRPPMPTVPAQPTTPPPPPLVPAPDGGTMTPPAAATRSEPARPQPPLRPRPAMIDTSFFTAHGGPRAGGRG